MGGLKYELNLQVSAVVGRQLSEEELDIIYQECLVFYKQRVVNRLELIKAIEE